MFMAGISAYTFVGNALASISPAGVRWLFTVPIFFLSLFAGWGLLLFLLLVPNTLSGRICILFVCGFILLVGLLMLRAGLKEPKGI